MTYAIYIPKKVAIIRIIDFFYVVVYNSSISSDKVFSMKSTKKVFFTMCAAVALLLTGCGTTEVHVNETGETASETKSEDKRIVIASGGKTDFVFVYDTYCEETAKADILVLRDAIKYITGTTVKSTDESLPEKEGVNEIIIGSEKRAVCADVTAGLKNNQYAIRVLTTDKKTQVILAFKGTYARLCCIDRFIKEFVTDGVCSVPADLDITGSCRENNVIITTNIQSLRDPFVIENDGTYYMYGTGWYYYKNTSGKLSGEWSGPYGCVTKPKTAAGDFWAPEVYRYGDAYYMFTTYRSSVTGHRGCSVFRSDSPDGPFTEISDGHVTPSDWDSIDGSLYIDPSGDPWMVFVHEWTSLSNGIGRMCAARLSKDLKKLISEPVELFAAKDAKWAQNGVTDGCFVHTVSDGSVLMIWSNWDKYGYCVGIATSDRIDGAYKQLTRRLYSKGIAGVFDGGHGMFFTDTDGRMYMVLHSPNSSTGGRNGMPIMIPVREAFGTVVWDVYRK